MAARKSGTSTRTSARKATGSAARKGRRGRHVASEVHEDELSPAPAGSQSLVIVESPAKAKTIGKYLGRGYRVRATVGHIMDLPEKKLGIDIEKGFEPELIPIPGKEKTIAELKSAAKDSREVFIATDPDREGVAIAAPYAVDVASGVEAEPGRKDPTKLEAFFTAAREGSDPDRASMHAFGPDPERAL